MVAKKSTRARDNLNEYRKIDIPGYNKKTREKNREKEYEYWNKENNI